MDCSIAIVLMGVYVCVEQGSDIDWDDLWDQFEERKYLSARKWKGGEDPYRLYAFNQRESERIPSDRAIRDTRHHRSHVLFPFVRCTTDILFIRI